MLNRLGTATLISGLLVSGASFASGYEKSVIWGGRSAGVAGIATPYIQGPQALFFNPAGLASDKTGQGVDLNLSALSTQFKGPINNQNDQAESDRKTLIPFGLIYGATLNEKFGFGVGGFISGGSQAKYDDIMLSGMGSDPFKVETDLVIGELSAGAGYRVTDKLKVGAAYRIVTARGKFSFIQRTGATSAINAHVNDLEGMNFSGFKLGAQYKLTDNTMLGLSYRSQVDLQVKGKLSAEFHTAAATTNLGENDATAGTTFPQAVTLGATHRLNESWNVMGEYVWTQYSRVDHVTLDGAVNAGGGFPGKADATDLEQAWHDQHQIKLAGEYLGIMMPIRFGYVWTSQVTNDDWARASFTPPANAHTVTLGTGKALNEKLTLDGALEYTWAKGSGNGGSAPDGLDIRPGTYEVHAFDVHLGASYTF